VEQAAPGDSAGPHPVIIRIDAEISSKTSKPGDISA
jgi:hypothetical protein